MPRIEGLYGSTVGHYAISRRFAPAATTLAGTLWTFRNPSNNLLAIPLRVRLRLLQVANATAAVEDRFSLKLARSYTAADATGSASIAASTGQQKLRTVMADSVAEVREANVAAGASGGTKTLDNNPIATGSIWVIATLPTANRQTADVVFDFVPDLARGEMPVILGQNEGFVVTNDNAMGTASGIVLLADFQWIETSVF